MDFKFYYSDIMKYFLTVSIILVMFVPYNHGCVRRRKENMRAPVIPVAVAVAELKSGRQRKGLRCWWNNATGYQCIDIDPRRRNSRRRKALKCWWNNMTGYQCIDIDPRRRITRRS